MIEILILNMQRRKNNGNNSNNNAALDSVFGGITSVLKGNFDIKIFISGFFGNAILSILLTWLGVKLNIDIYLAAIVVFVGRMFTNLAIIRRYYIDKWTTLIQKKKELVKNKKIESTTKQIVLFLSCNVMQYYVVIIYHRTNF